MARKYVMGNRQNGLSDVLSDEEVFFPETTARVLDLWINYETPANLSLTDDPTKVRSFEHEPPAGGAAFRIVEWKPGMWDDTSPEEMHANHEKLHSVHVPSLEYLRNAKHVSMHRTNTLNYFIVLSGKMWALSEGRDVLLEPGDIMIQHGCMHGWKIEGPEPCRMAAVLISGEFK